MSLSTFAADADRRIHSVGPEIVTRRLIISLRFHLNFPYSLSNAVNCSLRFSSYSIIVRNFHLCVESEFTSCLPMYDF